VARFPRPPAAGTWDGTHIDPDEAIPLLKSRRELSRAEALKLWSEKRKSGWKPCSPQW